MGYRPDLYAEPHGMAMCPECFSVSCDGHCKTKPMKTHQQAKNEFDAFVHEVEALRIKRGFDQVEVRVTTRTITPPDVPVDMVRKSGFMARVGNDIDAVDVNPEIAAFLNVTGWKLERKTGLWTHDGVIGELGTADALRRTAKWQRGANL